MYKEIPVQSRLIEKRAIDAENVRRQRKIQTIMNAPIGTTMSFRSISTAPNYRRKNSTYADYSRALEIEMTNKKLLENMCKIHESDYKSAVKTAL